MVAKTITKEKNSKIVKEVLSNSLRESDTVEEREFTLLTAVKGLIYKT